MTTKRDLKSITRERQRKTGESYTAARVHVMRERAHRLGVPDESSLLAPNASEAPTPEAPVTEPLVLGTPVTGHRAACPGDAGNRAAGAGGARWSAPGARRSGRPEGGHDEYGADPDPR